MNQCAPLCHTCVTQSGCVFPRAKLDGEKWNLKKYISLLQSSLPRQLLELFFIAIIKIIYFNIWSNLCLVTLLHNQKCQNFVEHVNFGRVLFAGHILRQVVRRYSKKFPTTAFK
jgi:hypothetical protein